MNVDKIINAVTKALRESSGEQAEVDRFMTSLREQAEESNSREVKRIVKNLLEREGVDVDEEELEESKKAKGKKSKKVSESEDEDDDGEELEESKKAKGKKSKKVSETEDGDEVEKKLDELEEAIRQSLGLSKPLVESEEDEDDEDEDLEKNLEEAIRSVLGGVGLTEGDDPETGDPEETGREGKDYKNKMLDSDGQTEDRLKESIQSMVDKSVERIILAAKR